jgi:hypothetical protein
MIKLGFALVFRLYVDQFGIAEIILFLIERTLLISCRLSTLWFTGSSFGVSCFRRTSGSTWFLDATAFEWLPRIFSTRLLGGLLRDYLMPSLLRILLFFRWLMFVSTLVDLWIVNFQIFTLLIKGGVHQPMQRPGVTPFRKKGQFLRMAVSSSTVMSTSSSSREHKYKIGQTCTKDGAAWDNPKGSQDGWSAKKMVIFFLADSLEISPTLN